MLFVIINTKPIKIVKTVTNRIKVYDDETKPLVEYYKNQNIILNIDGEQSISKVFNDIKKVVGV